MTETFIEDDPEPFPVSTINYETGDAYEGPSAKEYAIAQLLRNEQERSDIVALSNLCDDVLRGHSSAVGDTDDRRIYTNDLFLRRRRMPTMPNESIYFLVIDNHYCRSWSSHASEVHYCFDEERHEPARDVMARISERVAVETVSSRQRFSIWVLAKLRREIA